MGRQKVRTRFLLLKKHESQGKEKGKKSILTFEKTHYKAKGKNTILTFEKKSYDKAKGNNSILTFENKRSKQQELILTCELKSHGEAKGKNLILTYEKKSHKRCVLEMICFSLWFWLWCAFYNRSLKKHIILLSKCTSRLGNKRIHINLVSSVRTPFFWKNKWQSKEKSNNLIFTLGKSHGKEKGKN